MTGLLSYEELAALAARGVIRNVELEYINAASIDITLGAKILKEAHPNDLIPSMSVEEISGYVLDGPRQVPRHVISLRDRTPMRTTEEDCTKSYFLRPGEFILAQSEQEFYLPNDISAEYKLKSSMARTGINHALAGWCDAGWHGSVLTLELMNVSKHHIIQLKKGDRIGQMIFFHHREVPKDRSYAARGRYNGDKTVEGAKA